MDIILNGKIYVYFIRSVFEGNKKIGIEFIIDPKRSDHNMIDGLTRLNYLNRNKFIVYSGNYPTKYDFVTTKYTANFNMQNNFKDSKNVLILNNFDVINIDKVIIPNKQVNNKLYLNKYTTGKDKTIEDIMNIIKVKN